MLHGLDQGLWLSIGVVCNLTDIILGFQAELPKESSALATTHQGKHIYISGIGPSQINHI